MVKLAWKVVVLGWVMGQVGGWAEAAEGQFKCNSSGYVRHWLVVGPERSAYTGAGGKDDSMRREGPDKTVVEPPRRAELGAGGPFGKPWQFYYPGENYFVECSGFFHQLTRLDYYAYTEIVAPREMAIKGKLWAAGSVDVWVNDGHVCRYDVPRYMDPDGREIVVPLRAGINRVCVRLQGLGLRDTRMLFGLQMLESADQLGIRVPGPEAAVEQLQQADRWLGTVVASGRDALVSGRPLPAGLAAKVATGSKNAVWAAGASRVAIEPDRSYQPSVTMEVAGQKLQRLFEIPANRPAAEAAKGSIEEHRREIVRHIADVEKPAKDVMQLLARRLLKLPSEKDEALLESTLRGIESRRDCADFPLSALLRMYKLGMLSEAEAGKVKAVALAFRYWPDEPGKDAMAFGSENHSLLFHGCQLIAGQLFPDEVFSNSKRTGKAQVAIATRRCLEWLDKTERTGYQEYLSSTYMPLTVAALMNVVDFSGDAEMSRRAAALADRVFNDLALQAFDGVTVAPQGRVYRNVLYPQDSGTQALLSFATTRAAVSYNNWLTFVASSKTYRPPAGLEQLMERPLAKTYRQADVEIMLQKTGAYLLTSLQIPASYPPDKKGKPVGLQPGAGGRQQHLWYASLGRDIHVFVNHPGGSFDHTSSRPGYWYGNGTIPKLSQRENVLMEVFEIPGTHPIAFTHAHWPADAFDRQEVREHWAFGKKGEGYVALWCSEPLKGRNEALTGRELVADGRRVGWMCICGSAGRDGDFEAFIKRCLATGPKLDVSSFSIKAGLMKY